MRVITGAAGFIGSVVVRHLNDSGDDDLILVDRLDTSEKWKNLRGKRFLDYLDQEAFIRSLESGKISPRAVIHLGACSSTTERDAAYLMENNYRYSRRIAEWCLANNARMIYASSGATYGDGEQGFDDDPAQLESLVPLNMYGFSKHLFDLWAQQSGALDKIVGLKFFNVFGPNEYHKADMVSVVYKAFHQIQREGQVELFKSYNNQYRDGEQVRDFVYVKDCANVITWLLQHSSVHGLYNLGTGHARTWNDLAAAVFTALNRTPKISYVDMPEVLRGKYQYRTQADITRLRATGYTAPFTSLEDAVADYVVNYLVPNQYC